MNTILQQRIEEAAIKVSDVCEPCDYGDPFCASCHRQYMYDAAKKMGEVILNNQWISVEEALPKANELVFGCVNDEGVPQAVGMVYCDEYGGWHYSDEEEISLITNWMPIPSLEGGE